MLVNRDPNTPGKKKFVLPKYNSVFSNTCKIHTCRFYVNVREESFTPEVPDFYSILGLITIFFPYRILLVFRISH